VKKRSVGGRRFCAREKAALYLEKAVRMICRGSKEYKPSNGQAPRMSAFKTKWRSVKRFAGETRVAPASGSKATAPVFAIGGTATALSHAMRGIRKAIEMGQMPECQVWHSSSDESQKYQKDSIAFS